jgi:hypothetical protein
LLVQKLDYRRAPLPSDTEGSRCSVRRSHMKTIRSEAIYAAMRMQDDLRRCFDRLWAEGKASREIRIGINTGEVVIRSVGTGELTESVAVGHATSLAAQTRCWAYCVAAIEPVRRSVEKVGFHLLQSISKRNPRENI